MKKLLGTMAMLLLTGCAAGPIKVNVSDITQSESVQLSDVRPSNESEKETFSLLITSDAYAIYRNGDAVTQPSPLRLLQHRAYEKLSSNGDPLNIEVFHFVSYMNAQSTLRTGAVGSIFGPIGAGIATASKDQTSNFSYSDIDRNKFESIPADQEYVRAYYSESENPNDAMVFVIYIDAEINGKRRIVRSVAPSVNDNGDHPYTAALEKSISAFLEYFGT
tara:strand:- start:974 stop:1633 length:660 start_codon:yes stop_codon:yes gene_type:complete